ncbi:MAG: hypothetical protein ACREYB_06880 [Casimicrobiaceae bacterium]
MGEVKIKAQMDVVGLGARGQLWPTIYPGGQRYLGVEDQRAFTTAVARQGHWPDEFLLDVKRLPGQRPARAPTATLSITVWHLPTGRGATYFGGPGRVWVAEFLVDLIGGTFG